MTITDLDLIKEVLNKTQFYEQSTSNWRTNMRSLTVGRETAAPVVEEWALHRLAVTPAFQQHKIKVDNISLWNACPKLRNILPIAPGLI